jgi:hypothetical protein
MLGIRVLLVFTIVVAMIDAICCLCSTRFKIRYAKFVPVQMFFYGIMGSAAGFLGGLSFAVTAGAYVGLVDATLGFGIAWLLVPGYLPEGKISFLGWLRTAIISVVIGTIVFAIGGGIAAYYQSSGSLSHRS